MPRSRPAELRALQARRHHHVEIDGLPPAACWALNRLDMPELRPEALRRSLHAWRHISQLPQWQLDLTFPEHWSGWYGPGIDELDAVRGDLQRALVLLPRHYARPLRARIAPVDHRVLIRTWPCVWIQHAPWWAAHLSTEADYTQA